MSNMEKDQKREEVVIPLHRPDKKEMLFFFICGIIISVPITLSIAQFLDPLISGLDTVSAALVSIVLLAPLIEEFSKIFPIFYRHGETQRSIIQLAIMVGLGFGLAEFISYVSIGVAWYVRLPGLLFHPASTAISAYGIASKRPIPFFVLAVGFHFANNFLVLANPLPFSASIFVIGLTALTAWNLYRRTKEKIIL